MEMLVSIIALLFAAGILLFFYLRYRFSTELDRLFELSGVAPGKVFNRASLLDLPEPVRRYFNHVLQDMQVFPQTVRLIHKGQFKTALSNPWTEITGEQYFTSDPPGFIWKGTTSLFSAWDMYINGMGKLKVFLFSFLRIVNAGGNKINEGEILRWIAESVWFPTNLLPDEHRKWFPIDSHHARFSFCQGCSKHNLLITFNDPGEIIRITARRYRNKSLDIWVIRLAEYKRWNGVRIPTFAEAGWRIIGVVHPYARFKLHKLEYDKGSRF